MDSKMLDIVLSYPPLAERIAEKEGEKEKVLKKLDEIKADFSKTWIQPFEKVLDQVVGKLYDNINFTTGDMDFAGLVKNNHVILVPNHQSHADYVALNYYVYKHYRFPLYVAGGANLNVFPIGTLFRKCGCFFIRRTFSTDATYKFTLQAYLYYLLFMGKPIEFFFEGGRSRTGKMLPPRYGLFQMLLEAHEALPAKKKKELIFVPVSIVHEYVPEQRSLARELKGGKKKAESFFEILKVMKIFSYQLGSVHIKLGTPLQKDSVLDPAVDPKIATQNLAFRCFFQVGSNMMITPSSLLSMIMLDEPQGALKWQDILERAQGILGYCARFNVPITKSLENESLESALERAIDLFIANKKIDVIGKNSVGHVFYSIKPENRLELLYFKNSILHHFIIPWVVDSVWINIFSGKIEGVSELKRHFKRYRDQLKHEFYLPGLKDFISKGMDIISYAIGRDVKSFEECTSLTHKELYEIASKISFFSKGFVYIYEGQYIAALTIRALIKDDKEKDEKNITFTYEEFAKKAKELFDFELAHGKIVKFPESYSIPLLKNSLKYLVGLGIIFSGDGHYAVVDAKGVQNVISLLGDDILAHRSLNLKVNQ